MITGDLEGARRAVSRMPESSDSMIACFFQVSPAVVRDMRLKVKKRLPKSQNWPHMTDSPFSQRQIVTENGAEVASRKLNALCWRAYEIWGVAHNVPPEVAMAHLQLGARL